MQRGEGLGKGSEASKAGYQELRRPGYDAALALLDLTLVYAKQGRTSELKQLAVELSTIFEADDLHREAMGALVLLRKAAEEERVTVAMIEDVAGYLKRARSEPSLRFREGRVE